MSKELEFLVEKLTSFYRDNLPENSALEQMLRVYIRSTALYWSELQQLKKSMRLETTPTLSTLPYFKLKVEDGLYDKQFALRLSVLENLEDQIRELNDKKKFVQFEFSSARGKERSPAVYSFDLKARFSDSKELQPYEDYFLRNNRLYFLPAFILKGDIRVKEMHAFDIKLNEFIIEDQYGSFFDIETGPLVPRHQYRDVVSAFRQLLKSDMTIRDMKEAILLATDWHEFDIQDRFTPNLAPSLLRLYEDWLISPQRFIVTLPESLVADKMRLNILLSLLNEAKEAHTNYFMLFGISRTDSTNATDEARVSAQYKLKETVEPKDEFSLKGRYRVEENLFARHNYDTGRHYDYKLQYEGETMELPTVDGAPYIRMDDGEMAFDTPWVHQTEYVNVRVVEFPEIPRGFEMSSVGSELTFTLTATEEQVDRFELYESASEAGPFRYVKEVPNTGGEIVINYNANKAGNLYYKVRAAAKKEVSLFTLPISVSI